MRSLWSSGSRGIKKNTEIKMAIEQINPKIAFERMNDPSRPAVYLDVRSVQEYEKGHAQGAYNVPLLFRDEDIQQMVPNPCFIQDVEKRFSKDVRLVVGCMKGGRSQRACELLEEAGFQSLGNIQGGFGGAVEPSGGACPGWSQLDLPVETGTPQGRAYDE